MKINWYNALTQIAVAVVGPIQLASGSQRTSSMRHRTFWREKFGMGTEREREDFHPKGDGGSGRRPLPPDYLRFWKALH